MDFTRVIVGGLAYLFVIIIGVVLFLSGRRKEKKMKNTR
jgi:hypothetical protein